MKEANRKQASTVPHERIGTSVQEANPADDDVTTSHITSRLVLFDFDGTITTKDTLIEFVRFYRGRKQFLLGMLMLAPILGLLTLKAIPNWRAKQCFLARFFKGESLTNFNTRCYQFSTTVLPALIRPEAQKAILLYGKQNATIAVVTASAENWVKPWCDKFGLICLATQLETIDGVITGNLVGRNCYGDEKVCRVKDHFNLEQYDEIIAYGDSRGDREMLALAHKKYYKPFRSA
jgi:phosphatidylglycerophosphatase C